MRNETRKLYNAYLDRIARLNGVSDAAVPFTTAPSVQQTLENKIQESSEFLSRINVVGRAEQSGQKIGLGVSGPVAGTTDTAVADRAPANLVTLDDRSYTCTQTNFDTYITYGQLDAWAKFPDFQTRVRDAIVKRQALDRIMIGFNGLSRAATSNKAQNPLLQDVNTGWLAHYRQQAPGRVLSEVAEGSGVVRVGDNVPAAEGYRNLDALVFDAVNNLIDPWFAESTELVAICGRALLADKYFPIVNRTQPNSETLAADLILSQKRIGNLPAVRVPFFPANAMLVTSLSNLSIYYQEQGRRRTVVDNAKRDRIENYESSNDAYVVEDYGFGCLIEHIELAEAGAATA